jgi:acetoin utilization deacetylase AcuC-like enzyme
LGKRRARYAMKRARRAGESLSACLDRGPGPHARRRRRADKLWGGHCHASRAALRSRYTRDSRSR